MFQPLENGLVLLEHINQHLEEGLGLRQIWLWQLCRYLRLGLKREQPLKGLMQDVKKTRTKDALMEELGVKRIKKGTATRDGVMF